MYLDTIVSFVLQRGQVLEGVATSVSGHSSFSNMYQTSCTQNQWWGWGNHRTL